MDIALDMDLEQLDAANDDAVGNYTDDEANAALFPQIHTLNERQFLAVMRDDQAMLDDFLGQHYTNLEQVVAAVALHGVMRNEFHVLGIPVVYHHHYIKLSMALLIFSLYERNFAKFSDMNSILLVAAPMCHLMNPRMVDPAAAGPSLRLSTIFQVLMRFACDVTANITDARPLRERFLLLLNKLEIGYSEHLGLIDALERFMANPENVQLHESITRQ